MKFKNWLYLYGMTFLWGGVAGLIIRLILAFLDPNIVDWRISDWVMAVIGAVWTGFMFSALSTLGFFIFLLLNQLGLGLFRRYSLWQGFMYILIGFTFADYIYLSYTYFAQEGDTLFNFIAAPVILLIWAIIVAFKKMKETNKKAYAPTLFFMFTMTVLELFPAIRENNIQSLLIMAFPLVAANTWQILTLHKVQKKS